MQAIYSNADSWVRRAAVHGAVALGYALAYMAIRPLSVSYWPFAAGLRVACLMLVPRRYWSALVVGEVIPLTYFNMQCLDDAGITWVVLSSVPFIALGMPVMNWFRNRAGLFPTPGMVNITRLLGCLLALSVMWASINYITLATVQLRSGLYVIPSGMWMMYLIGNYTVLLLVVPWAIMIRIRGRRHIWPLWRLRTPINHPLVRDLGIATMVLMTMVAWYRIASGSLQSTLLMAMFFPAVWLTLKHGWRASVIGGTLSLASICGLLAWGTEPEAQQAQTLMAMAITSLYFFGARISEQGRAYGRVQQHARDDKNVARDALAQGEDRLQRTSHALDCMAVLVQSDYIDALKRYVPTDEWHNFYGQAEQLRRSLLHLSESLYPSAWRERGLGAALHDAIGKALREAGLCYECDTVGRELRFLSPALQAALYRVACDAVTVLAASPACIGMHMAVRTGRRQGRRWIVLRIQSQEDSMNVAQAVLQGKQRHSVSAALGASLRSAEEARKLVRVFDGLMTMRELSDGKRIAMLLCDQAPHAAMPTAAIRLWVE
jgi:glucose-6-phosphate-specific signal transduction histidine kinase